MTTMTQTETAPVTSVRASLQAGEMDIILGADHTEDEAREYRTRYAEAAEAILQRWYPGAEIDVEVTDSLHSRVHTTPETKDEDEAGFALLAALEDDFIRISGEIVRERETRREQLGYRWDGETDDRITATDLRAEIDEARANERCPRIETALVTILGGRDERPESEHLQVAFFPTESRAGLAWGGDAQWTDAESIDDAVQRFLGVGGKEMCE